MFESVLVFVFLVGVFGVIGVLFVIVIVVVVFIVVGNIDLDFVWDIRVL